MVNPLANQKETSTPNIKIVLPQIMEFIRTRFLVSFTGFREIPIAGVGEFWLKYAKIMPQKLWGLI
jgi:hypothetical protein